MQKHKNNKLRVALGFLATTALAACGSGGGGSSGATSFTTNVPGDSAGAAATCRTSDAAPLPTRSGLPVVSSGQRPGPALLYAPAPVAPQLENRDPRFRAAPIMVQGQERYIDGEYLYQDYIYDDYGSDVSNDDLNETGITVGNSGLNGLEPRVGDIDYPTNFERYGGNAADLLEFRVAPGESDIAYRISLNTLLQPDSTITAIVFDTDNNPATGVSTLPRDPGAPFPGSDEVIYLWGTGAEHVRLSSGGNIATPLNIATDLQANQMWVFVPRSLHNPQGAVGVTVATGLYDTGSGGWLMPGDAPTATQPGEIKPGLVFDPNPAGIFNLAFRFDEPVVGENTPPDTLQSARIREKNPNAYQHAINYDDLTNRVNRDSVPTSGVQMRLYASSLSLNRDGTRSADNSGEGRDLTIEDPSYFGQLQPYAIYVPTAAEQGNAPLPLHWAFHSNGQEHWQYNGSQYVQQIGEQFDAFVPTPLGRGPGNWYDQGAEVDVFEIWADIARNFNIDANRTATTGYSMGGYASYRLGVLYPDLFGKAFTQVGPPGERMWIPPNAPTEGFGTLTNLILENTRHLPFLNIAMVMDELVPYPGPQTQNLGDPRFAQFTSFQELGYRYRFQTYPQGEHFTLFLLDNFPMAAPFLEDVQVDRNPYHVTYSIMPVEDDPEFGLIHDHAYWVSGMVVADDTSADGLPAKGSVDAFSHACGMGTPGVEPIADAGTIPLPYAEVGQAWTAAPDITGENRLSLNLTNLAAVTLDLPRSGLRSNAPLTIDMTTDVQGLLTLTGQFSPNSTVQGAQTREATTTRIVLAYTPGEGQVVVITP